MENIMRNLSSVFLSAGIAALIAFTPLTSAHASNLVVNGGFETGDFTGWIEGGNLGSTYVGNSPNTPFDGNYAAQLGAVGSDNTLSQVLSTVAGSLYTISYWHIYAPGAGPPGDFSVLWDGTTIHSEVSQNPPTPQTWTEYSFQVTGTGSDTLEFDSRNDPSYQGLDDVSVDGASISAIPLPATLPLFGSVLLGFGVFANRRKIFARI
jgi:hypothetical protein